MSKLELVKNKRSQIRNDKDFIHIFKYMGSKRELLPEIKQVISSMINPNDGILDIFSGTGNVGNYLKNDYNIYTNDIQEYTSVITDSIIGASLYKELPPIDEKLKEIKSHYFTHKSYLTKMLKKTLAISDSFVSIEKKDWNEEKRLKYKEFCNSLPSPINGYSTTNDEFNKLFNIYLERSKSKNNSFPYCQISFLFSETYFSLEQTIDIDSLKYAIDKTFTHKIFKNIFMAALIHAFSYSSSGTGHFAMFRDLVDVKSVKDTFIYRGKSVFELFEKKLHEIYSHHKFIPQLKYESYNLDYSILLKNKEISHNYKLIYADPPYSSVHYSRFYHAIESLVKYDYDIPTFKGRYRSDRHQSPFCQKQNVKGAFELLYRISKENSSSLLLSYADTGMISLETILEISKHNGFITSVIEIDYDHSTMGRKGHKSNKIKEFLIKSELPSDIYLLK